MDLGFILVMGVLAEIFQPTYYVFNRHLILISCYVSVQHLDVSNLFSLPLSNNVLSHQRAVTCAKMQLQQSCQQRPTLGEGSHLFCSYFSGVQHCKYPPPLPVPVSASHPPCPWSSSALRPIDGKRKVLEAGEREGDMATPPFPLPGESGVRPDFALWCKGGTKILWLYLCLPPLVWFGITYIWLSVLKVSHP